MDSREPFTVPKQKVRTGQRARLTRIHAPRNIYSRKVKHRKGEKDESEA